MENTYTGPLQKSLSRVFPNDQAASAAEILFLLGMGMIAMTIHSKLRVPMHLPGKQGLIFVAIIVFSRGMSKYPFASSMACLGSAALLMTGWMGFRDLFMPLTYLAIGVVFDLFYAWFSRFPLYMVFVPLASGISWAFMPLFKLIISFFTGVPQNAFISGIAYPFLTHLLFGLAGGLAGAGVVKLITRK